MLKHCWLPEYRVDQTPGPGTMGFVEGRMYDDGFRLGQSKGAKMRVRRKPIGWDKVRGQFTRPS